MPNTNTNTQHDFKGFDDYIEVFKAGKRTDSKGRTQTFTTADLDEMVANVESPVPHRITHKGLYSPFAYAQTLKGMVKRVGDSLYAKADKVEAQFEKLVKDGRLFERSIGIRKGDNGWKIDHIAWLGAEPPAVEGMAPVEFEAGDNFFEFKLGDGTTPNMISRILRRVREFLIEQHGLEVADKTLPSWEIDSLAEHANHLNSNSTYSAPDLNTPPQGEEPMPEFSQADIDKAVADARADEQKKHADDKAEFERQQNDKLKAETDKRKAVEFTAEINALIDVGTLKPAQTEGMCEFMLQLEADDNFEFSAGEEGKAQTVKKSALDWFKNFTASLGKQIDMDQSDAGANLDVNESEFSMPGAQVSPERLELHNKALEYMRSHDGVSYLDAVKAVDK